MLTDHTTAILRLRASYTVAGANALTVVVIRPIGVRAIRGNDFAGPNRADAPYRPQPFE
jgi:hypothetical protein